MELIILLGYATEERYGAIIIRERSEQVVVWGRVGMWGGCKPGEPTLAARRAHNLARGGRPAILALAGMGWCGCGVSGGNGNHSKRSTVLMH